MTVAEETISRTGKLRAEVLDARYGICIERARYVTEAWRASEGSHPSVRAAAAFENTLRNMTVRIGENERIAGNQTSYTVGTLLPVERGEMNLVLEMDLDNLLTRAEKPYTIRPGDRKELLTGILPYWRGRTLRDAKRREFERRGLVVKPSHGPVAILNLVRAFGPEALETTLSRFVKGRGPLQLLTAADELPINNPNMVNNVFDTQGHLVVGHNRVMRLGFEGMAREAEEKLRGCDANGRAFLESVIRCCEAAKMFAGRYSELAARMAEHETDPLRRAEFEEISRCTARVPWHAPETFREGVQALWLTGVMSQISYGMAGICAIGRPDQYLYPLYETDLSAGIITRGEAIELIEELLIKLSNNLIMLPSYAKDTGSELGADSMAPTFGGLGTDGEDATNELSFLFLDAVNNIRGMSNSYSVRISAKTDADFLAKISEVQAATNGMALFNDEVIIPGLLSCGCSLEDARDYAIVGCVEPTPQGNTFGCTSGNDVSLAGALEMAMRRGSLLVAGRRTGPHTPDPAKMDSFEQLFDAYTRQMSHAVELVAKCVDAKDEAYAAGFHNPFISATLDGCVSNARDMTQGGARYNFSSIGGRGAGTVADSLAAIKKFVFDEKSVTMSELLEALATNFRGREKLRRMLEMRGPKYGTDAEGDEVARRVVGEFCRVVSARKSVRGGGGFRPGFFTYGMHVFDGSLLGATADGRLAGRPVSNSLSPSNTSGKNGPTALMASVASIGHERITNGSSLNVKLMPMLLERDDGRRRFEAMVRGYFALGGLHVQFNLVDAATLREAQRNPEKYAGLTVRVSGYSAYFTDLGRPLQDEIISRTVFSGF